MAVTKEDLAELVSASLTGVTIGIGSQVLIFDNGASVLIQCRFVCSSGGAECWGHGERVDTSPLLFGFLGHAVTHAALGADGGLVLIFEGMRTLTVVPERNGLESYVLSTRLGICPVSVM